ncbi:MAG: DNA repair protein RadC [Oscillospiraceae bacterium]|jgi:DNA repair protein RadC|nr:DNA repair protein RadC [Oscillospiraceae bacterium]
MDKQKREKGAKKENVHAGHRQRLKNKYLSSGADVLEPHELLELLLFYAVPRANTNPIAHALIKRFGSLKNVLTAPVEELTKVEGVGESSALLISLFPRVYCRALSDSMEEEAEILDTSRRLGAYFVTLLSPERNEVMYQLCLDAKGRLLKRFKINEGNSGGVDFDVRKIAVNALSSNAVSVVLAHNHPSGLALPSQEDCAGTEEVREALAAIGVALADHIIVADNDYISFRDSHLLR